MGRLSQIEAFFRNCPECGRRFHVRLVSKKLIGFQRETAERRRFLAGGTGQMGMGGQRNPTTYEENTPVTINTEDTQYSYKCKACGHEWTENRIERHRED